MTTERELLELAAKAADIPFNALPHSNSAWTKWNPLTDDGDALRLAVKLGMWLYIGKGELAATSVTMPEFDNAEQHNDDPYAATRLAIVRAAAELGRNQHAE